MLRAAQLLERLSTSPDDEVAANDLLEEFSRGYPVHVLEDFLESDNPRRVRVGVWLASELGVKAAPLVDVVASLLTHPERYVRFYAVDVIFSCAAPDNPRPVAAAICSIADDDASVRWKIMWLLAHVSIEIVERAGSYLTCDSDKGTIREGLQSLVQVNTISDANIRAMLGDTSSIMRRFGAICAYRARSRLPKVYNQARTSVDCEITEFLKDIE